MSSPDPLAALDFRSDAVASTAEPAARITPPAGVTPLEAPKAKYLEGSYRDANGVLWSRNGKRIGRKASDANPTRQATGQAQNGVSPSPDPFADDVEKLRAEYSEGPASGTPPGAGDPSATTPSGGPSPAQPPAFAFVPTGPILLTACDAVFPTVVAWWAQRKGRSDIKASMLRMDRQERDMLKPMADPAAAYLLQHVNPLVLFLVSMAGVYAAKIPPAPSRVRKQAAPRSVEDLNFHADDTR